MNLKPVIAKVLSQFAIEIPWLYDGNNPLHIRPFSKQDILLQATEALEKEILNVLQDKSETEVSEQKD